MLFLSKYSNNNSVAGQTSSSKGVNCKDAEHTVKCKDKFLMYSKAKGNKGKVSYLSSIGKLSFCFFLYLTIIEHTVKCKDKFVMYSKGNKGKWLLLKLLLFLK